MLRTLLARLAIGAAVIGAGGSVAGVGLANYTESGDFHFYKQPRMGAWPAVASEEASGARAALSAGQSSSADVADAGDGR